MRYERDRARDQVNSHLQEYLEGKGLPLKKHFTCQNPDHPDNNPSMNYDSKRNKVHCHACGADYDLIDLIGIDYGLEDYNEKLKKGCDLYGIRLEERNQGMSKKEAHHGRSDRLQTNKVTTTENNNLVTTKDSTGPEEEKDLTALFDKWHSQLDQTDYLRNRGISPEVAARFKVGYCQEWRSPKTPEGPASPRLIIPTSKGTYTARAINDNDPRRYMNAYGNPPMNLEALNGDRPVYIVEGEIDALSIVEAGGEAIGLGSVSNWKNLVSSIEATRPKRPLILALDNDKPGQEATGNLKEALEGLGVPTYLYNPYGGHKDANAALLADRAAFYQAVWDGTGEAERIHGMRVREYRATSVAGYLDDFLERNIQAANTPAIPTGFTRLDNLLDGGLHPELIILGAITGLGKTTLALQIMDQMAAGGHDVLFFSLEMSRYELIAKSISRQTAVVGMSRTPPIGRENWKTNRGISKYERYVNYSNTEKDLIKDATEEYRGMAGHIFINEGLGNITVDRIGENIQRHLDINGKPPAAVFIDYLQILAPDDPRATDKQNTDRAVFELKRLSRSINIPVIAISSLNRQNYRQKINLTAFKESGAIEYSSDLLIGLDLYRKDTDKEKDISQRIKKMERDQGFRDIDFHILKNRNGPLGEPIAFKYYPKFNLFQEYDRLEEEEEEEEDRTANWKVIYPD